MRSADSQFLPRVRVVLENDPPVLQGRRFALVGTDDGARIGEMRFERSGNGFILTHCELQRAHRGCGLATEALAGLCEALRGQGAADIAADCDWRCLHGVRLLRRAAFVAQDSVCGVTRWRWRGDVATNATSAATALSHYFGDHLAVRLVDCLVPGVADPAVAVRFLWPLFTRGASAFAAAFPPNPADAREVVRQLGRFADALERERPESPSSLRALADGLRSKEVDADPLAHVAAALFGHRSPLEPLLAILVLGPTEAAGRIRGGILDWQSMQMIS